MKGAHIRVEKPPGNPDIWIYIDMYNINSEHGKNEERNPIDCLNEFLFRHCFFHASQFQIYCPMIEEKIVILRVASHLLLVSMVTRLLLLSMFMFFDGTKKTTLYTPNSKSLHMWIVNWFSLQAKSLSLQFRRPSEYNHGYKPTKWLGIIYMYYKRSNRSP